MAHNKLKSCISAFALAGLLSVSSAGAWQEPDNTKANKRAQPTADNAKENVSDRELMQKIRKSIVADKGLSTYAHNVKVIAQHGKITLKGPVNSEEEKTSVEAKAVEVAGAANVVNEIQVRVQKATTTR